MIILFKYSFLFLFLFIGRIHIVMAIRECISTAGTMCTSSSARGWPYWSYKEYTSLLRISYRSILFLPSVDLFYFFYSSSTVIITNFSNPIKIKQVNHVIIIYVCIERKSNANFQLRNFCTHHPHLLPPWIISTFKWYAKKIFVPICWYALFSMLIPLNVDVFPPIFWWQAIFLNKFIVLRYS